MGEAVKLSPRRQSALKAAARPQGLPWERGDRRNSATCGWLFGEALVEWGWHEGKQVLIATPAGRAALPTPEDPTDG